MCEKIWTVPGICDYDHLNQAQSCFPLILVTVTFTYPITIAVIDRCSRIDMIHDVSNMGCDGKRINPFCDHFWRKGHSLKTTLANSNCSLRNKLIWAYSIPATFLMVTHKGPWHQLRLGFWWQVTHVNEMLWDITCIVVVACNKNVWDHALKCELLQQENSLPLATKKLMDQQSRLDEVINPMHPSWMLSTNLKVLAQIMKCLWTSSKESSQKCSGNHPEGMHCSYPSLATQDSWKPTECWGY